MCRWVYWLYCVVLVVIVCRVMELVIHMMSEFISEHLMAHILLITLASALMIVAMIVDLVFGVYKARQLGEATTSTGLKKTCEKARKYFSPFAVLVCIDLLSSVISPAPAFSLLWASYCIFCEFISVREKAWQKAELRKQERTMSIILENKDDIAKLIAELIKKGGVGNG